MSCNYFKKIFRDYRENEAPPEIYQLILKKRIAKKYPWMIINDKDNVYTESFWIKLADALYLEICYLPEEKELFQISYFYSSEDLPYSNELDEILERDLPEHVVNFILFRLGTPFKHGVHYSFEEVLEIFN